MLKDYWWIGQWQEHQPRCWELRTPVVSIHPTRHLSPHQNERLLTIGEVIDGLYDVGVGHVLVVDGHSDHDTRENRTRARRRSHRADGLRQGPGRSAGRRPHQPRVRPPGSRSSTRYNHSPTSAEYRLWRRPSLPPGRRYSLPTHRRRVRYHHIPPLASDFTVWLGNRRLYHHRDVARIVPDCRRHDRVSVVRHRDGPVALASSARAVALPRDASIHPKHARMSNVR